MSTFLKKSSTKKLNIHEIWQVYRLLKDGLNRKSDTYLLDEITNILGGISAVEFEQTLGIMNIPNTNALNNLLAFVKNLKANEFFSFVSFIRGINSGRSSG